MGGGLPPLPWGRTRHVIRLIPHTGKHDLITHTRAHMLVETPSEALLCWTCECLPCFYLKSSLCLSLHGKYKAKKVFKWHQFSKNLVSLSKKLRDILTAQHSAQMFEASRPGYTSFSTFHSWVRKPFKTYSFGPECGKTCLAYAHYLVDIFFKCSSRKSRALRTLHWLV